MDWLFNKDGRYVSIEIGGTGHSNLNVLGQLASYILPHLLRGTERKKKRNDFVFRLHNGKHGSRIGWLTSGSSVFTAKIRIGAV